LYWSLGGFKHAPTEMSTALESYINRILWSILL